MKTQPPLAITLLEEILDRQLTCITSIYQVRVAAENTQRLEHMARFKFEKGEGNNGFLKYSHTGDWLLPNIVTHCFLLRQNVFLY